MNKVYDYRPEELASHGRLKSTVGKELLREKAPFKDFNMAYNFCPFNIPKTMNQSTLKNSFKTCRKVASDPEIFKTLSNANKN